MAKLLITTQVYENYGAHSWNGYGDCPQYWKPKGGSDYVVLNFTGGDVEATDAVIALRPRIECNDDFCRETVMGWNLVADDYLTDFEQSQLEYDGKIMFSPQILTLETQHA